jgi:hypothetical protein
MAKAIYGPDTSAYAGAGTGQGPALIKPSAQGQFESTDPRTFVHTRLAALRGHYEGQYNATSDLQEAAKIQQEYDVEKFKLADSLAQIDYIQKLIDSGYDPEAGLRAQREVAGIRLPRPTVDPREQRLQQVAELERSGVVTPEQAAEIRSRIELFPEAESVVYRKPEQEPRGRFSARELGHGDLMGLIEDHQARGFNPDGSYNPVLMKQQYFRARQRSFYGQMNSAQKREWEVTWLDTMYDPEARRRWQGQVKSDPDLYAGKAGDSPLMRVADSKAIGGSIVSPSWVSPIARGIVGQRPKTAQQSVEDFTTMSDEELIRIAGGM